MINETSRRSVLRKFFTLLKASRDTDASNDACFFSLTTRDYKSSKSRVFLMNSADAEFCFYLWQIRGNKGDNFKILLTFYNYIKNLNLLSLHSERNIWYTHNIQVKSLLHYLIYMYVRNMSKCANHVDSFLCPSQ